MQAVGWRWSGPQYGLESIGTIRTSQFNLGALVDTNLLRATLGDGLYPIVEAAWSRHKLLVSLQLQGRRYQEGAGSDIVRMALIVGMYQINLMFYVDPHCKPGGYPVGFFFRMYRWCSTTRVTSKLVEEDRIEPLLKRLSVEGHWEDMSHRTVRLSYISNMTTFCAARHRGSCCEDWGEGCTWLDDEPFTPDNV